MIPANEEADATGAIPDCRKNFSRIFSLRVE
jgi:hypothetical protein